MQATMGKNISLSNPEGDEHQHVQQNIHAQKNFLRKNTGCQSLKGREENLTNHGGHQPEDLCSMFEAASSPPHERKRLARARGLT